MKSVKSSIKCLYLLYSETYSMQVMELIELCDRRRQQHKNENGRLCWAFLVKCSHRVIIDVFGVNEVYGNSQELNTSVFVKCRECKNKVCQWSAQEVLQICTTIVIPPFRYVHRGFEPSLRSYFSHKICLASSCYSIYNYTNLLTSILSRTICISSVYFGFLFPMLSAGSFYFFHGPYNYAAFWS